MAYVKKDPRDSAENNPNQLTDIEIKNAWERIDRRLKRATDNTEIVGKPDYLVADPENTPIVFGDDKLNILGNLSAKYLARVVEKNNKEKYIKSIRYKKLESAHEQPEIEGILNIYADEATTENSEGEIIKIAHPNKNVIEIVDDCFTRCGIYDKSWEIIWNMCGYGDEYYEMIPNQLGTKILKIAWLPREYIDRIEKDGALIGFKPSATVETESQYTFSVDPTKLDLTIDQDNLVQPWRVLHFRIPNAKYMPYGKAVIDNVVSSIEQLNLMVKSMLIARVTRAPERRVYNVDVGTLQGEKAIRYAQEAVGYLKRKKVLQVFGGAESQRPDMIRDVFGSTEDIILPKRTGSEGNSISTLDQIAAISTEDADFIRDRIFPPVGVPRQYLFDDTFSYANTNLSSKSVPFGKKIRRVQRYYLQQLYKLATIELKLNKVSDKDIDELVLLMNNPSNIDEKERVENHTALWSLITTIKGMNAETVFYPDYLIYKNYLKLTDDQIVEVLKLAQLQASGQNIFDFLPPNERPKGAEDLTTATPETGEEGEMGAGSSGLPSEVTKELGPAPTGAPGEGGAEGGEGTVGAPPAGAPAPGGGGAPAAPETAEYIANVQEVLYTEHKEDLIEANIRHLQDMEMRVENTKLKERTALLENALKKKHSFLKKKQEVETVALFEDIKHKFDVAANPNYISEEKHRKVLIKGKTTVDYLENYGELGGLKDWMASKTSQDYFD